MNLHIGRRQIGVPALNLRVVCESMSQSKSQIDRGCECQRHLNVAAEDELVKEFDHGADYIGLSITFSSYLCLSV